MKAALAAGALLALASCSMGPPAGPYEIMAQRLANRAKPSDVIATELAFARAAQEKGQWTAFAEYAADNAVMFVPEPVSAKEWLKGRENPAEAVKWQPHKVWSSCDGSLAVTKGAWQTGSETGYFTTVWQRQEDGSYQWVMDQGDRLDGPLAEPEMVQAKVADCTAGPLPPITVSLPSKAIFGGTARDGTLQWSVTVAEDGSRGVLASYWDGSGWRPALREQVLAESE